VKHAAERGVAIFAFRDRSADPPASTLQLGYANVPEPSIEPALRELRAAYGASLALGRRDWESRRDRRGVRSVGR
jgi:DNA-binding transcriptional MocR family regulator